MPLRFLKARRHLYYVRVGQQGEGWIGKQPTVRTIRPLPRPGSRGDAHLTQSRRKKGTVLPGWVGPQFPGRRENLLTPC